MLPKLMGNYAAQPTEWSVVESGQNKTPTWVCHFNLSQFEERGNWVDCNYDITGYFYLFKTTGEPNTHTIDSLKKSIGWDGRSISGLATGEWSEKMVQLVIDQEDYQGKKRTKVKFINPLGSGGRQMEKADPQIIQSLDAKYGAMLRAIAGAPAQANGGAAKPASVPAAGPKPGTAAGPQSQPPTDPVAAGKRKAWDAFLAKWKPYVAENPTDAGLRDEKWRSLLADIFQGQDPKTVDAKGWENAASLIDADYSAAVGTLIPI